MKPTQKIKATIILQSAKDFETEIPEDFEKMTREQIDEFYEFQDYQDTEQDFREGEVETEIQAEWSRHYETKSVAAKMFDGSWVGWTYWYGGGKHGEPEAIDWMSNAYDLDCKEEEKLVVVRTFSKK
jgi:hypothetical protein